MNTLIARLLLLVGIALLPTLGFETHFLVEARRAREQAIRDDAMRLVGMVAAQQNAILEGGVRY